MKFYMYILHLDAKYYFLKINSESCPTHTANKISQWKKV